MWKYRYEINLAELSKILITCVLSVLIFADSSHADDLVRNLILSNEYQLPRDLNVMISKPDSNLTVEKCSYVDFNAVEFRMRAKASEAKSSTRFEEIRSADFRVTFPSSSPATLLWSKGSHAEVTDFEPCSELLRLNKPFVLESFGGRSSDGVMPYFNLSNGLGGLILAIGWTGDWKATFESLGDGQVHVAAGLKQSSFVLEKGMDFRLPSILLMSYRGTAIDGQNQFRRLMLSHFTPKSHSIAELMPVAASVHGMFGFNDTNEKNLTSLASEIASLNLTLDTFWLDAGWNEGGFPQGQGNPNADPIRFPQGLVSVGNAVSKIPMRFLVWFEPERAMRRTWIEREHPDWLLAPNGTPDELRYMETDGFRLLDLGNNQAREWALETVSADIRKLGISIYRQDFNEYPSYFWGKVSEADSDDRRMHDNGIGEIRYINGLYDFLDELVQRNPGLIIDNCASGGRRLDFEMMKRSVVLWRSDSCWGDKSFPRNVQAMSYGLSYWLPLHGLGAHTTDKIALRSGMGACGTFPINFRDPSSVSSLRKFLAQYQSIRHIFAADFYPLTSWSVDPKRWLAYQFHDSAKDAGIVQAFCSDDSKSNTLMLTFRGLNPEDEYEVMDWDEADTAVFRGDELMSSGIELQAGPDRQAIVLQYSLVP